MSVAEQRPEGGGQKVERKTVEGREGRRRVSREGKASGWFNPQL